LQFKTACMWHLDLRILVRWLNLLHLLPRSDYPVRKRRPAFLVAIALLYAVGISSDFLCFYRTRKYSHSQCHSRIHSGKLGTTPQSGIFAPGTFLLSSSRIQCAGAFCLVNACTISARSSWTTLWRWEWFSHEGINANHHRWQEGAQMFNFLQILTAILIAVALALALAHALEFPGKMRLTGSVFCHAVHLLSRLHHRWRYWWVRWLNCSHHVVLYTFGSAEFWLTLVALLGLVGMQAVYCSWRTQWISSGGVKILAALLLAFSHSGESV